MKRYLTVLLFMLSFSFSGFAQEAESAKPLTDAEVVRRVAVMDIEGDIFNNVVVTMKSTSPDYFITDKYKVKVSIVDANGKKIWKKTLKNVFLYVFSNGQVQIGRRNFDQIIIHKSAFTGDFQGIIRVKEGVY